MGMNFPDVPTNGQVFGIYTWDGEKWIVTPVAPGGGITQADADIRYVNIPGDTMTGALTLPGNPTAALHAATKQYVDSNSLTPAAADAAYVNVAGDTMTGALFGPRFAVSPGVAGVDIHAAGANNLVAAVGPSGGFYVQDSAATTNYLALVNGLATFSAGVISNANIQAGAGTTGTYYFGNTNTKYLGYDGTNYTLAGGTNFIVNATDFYIGGYAGTVGYLRFGNSGTKYLNYDGTNFNLVGGPLYAPGATVSGDITVYRSGTPATGLIFFGTTGTKYIYFDGGNYSFTGGNVYAPNVYSIGNVNVGVNYTTTGAGAVIINGGNSAGMGAYISFNRNNANTWSIGNQAPIFGPPNNDQSFCLYNPLIGQAARFDYTNNGFLIYAGAWKPGGGVWADNSDARIKNELGEYTRGLDEIAQLRPIYYTFKGNDTPEPPAYPKAALDANPKLADKSLTAPYPNSNHKTVADNAIKYAGLIAQEVELVFPEMVTKRSSYIDGVAVEDLRDLDTTPLIFALVNAVKELKARIEVLEAP